MKRAGLWAIGIGVLVSVGSLTVEQGYAGDNNGAPKCSRATLKGRYLFGGTSTVLPPAFGVTEPSLGSAAGYHIFNGDGTGQDFVTFLLNGIIVPVPSPNHFTYTLNSDCTGIYSVLPLNYPNFDIFVSLNGDELTTINIDPGAVGVFAPSRRVAPK